MVNRNVQLKVQSLHTKFKKKNTWMPKVCSGQCESGLRPEETSSWLTVLTTLPVYGLQRELLWCQEMLAEVVLKMAWIVVEYNPKQGRLEAKTFHILQIKSTNGQIIWTIRSLVQLWTSETSLGFNGSRGLATKICIGCKQA